MCLPWKSYSRQPVFFVRQAHDLWRNKSLKQKRTKNHPKKLRNHQGTRKRVWHVSWICFVYFCSCLFHAWASLRILCLASKVWLWEWFTTHSQLETNNQPPTTKPDPKCAIKCFSPWIYEHATPKSWNFGSVTCFFSFFQLGVIFLRFQALNFQGSTYIPLPCASRQAILHAKDPRRMTPSHLPRGTRWESRNDVYVKGYLDGFFHPQKSLENTIDTMGTLSGTVHPIVPWLHPNWEYPSSHNHGSVEHVSLQY